MFNRFWTTSFPTPYLQAGSVSVWTVATNNLNILSGHSPFPGKQSRLAGFIYYHWLEALKLNSMQKEIKGGINLGLKATKNGCLASGHSCSQCKMTRSPKLEGWHVPLCTPLCRASPQSNLCWRQKAKEDVKRGQVLGRRWSVRMSSRRHGQKESLTGRPRGRHREQPARPRTEAWSCWPPGVFLPQTTTHSSGFHVHLHPQADTVSQP